MTASATVTITTGDIITGIYTVTASATSEHYNIYPSSDEIGWGAASAYCTASSGDEIKNYTFAPTMKHDDEKNIDCIDCGDALCFYQPEGKTGAPIGLIVTHKDTVLDKWSQIYHFYTELYYGGNAIVFDPDFKYDEFNMNVMPHEEIPSSTYTLPECEFDPERKSFTGCSFNGETYQPGDTIQISEKVTVLKAQ